MRLFITPTPSRKLYHVVAHPDRKGWYQVIEGDHYGAPVIANCPNESYARAVCSGLNEKRERAELGAQTIRLPIIIGQSRNWN